MESATTTSAAPEAPPKGASNADLVRWTIAQINAHDVEPVKALWEHTVEAFPGLTVSGPEEIADYFNGVFAAMPDARIEILALAEDGENVLMRWLLTGTFNGGDFMGIAATGSSMAVYGCDHFVIRDGKIVSNDVVFDRLDFAQQIGMMPPDESLADRALKGAFNVKTKAVQAVRNR